MAARATWSGYLRISLVAVPVKAYSAAQREGTEIRLNQLHGEEGCHRRIRYLKTCPEHGEVEMVDIVSGYADAKGQYVTIDDEELDKIRGGAEKAITIDTFIEPGTVDPTYFGGRTYYLLPDGRVAAKPYALLVRAMTEEGRHAIAQAVLTGREQLVLVRPLEGLLVMHTLHYDQQVKRPSAFKDEVPGEEASPAELKLTKTLIDASTAEEFDLSQYHDEYVARLTRLVEAKVAGEEIVSPPEAEEAPVINIMDALRASVAAHEAKRRPSPPSRRGRQKGKLSKRA
jgi:DNA end-binding protein Ku